MSFKNLWDQGLPSSPRFFSFLSSTYHSPGTMGFLLFLKFSFGFPPGYKNPNLSKLNNQYFNSHWFQVPPSIWIRVIALLGCPYLPGNQPLLPVPTCLLQLSTHWDLIFPITFRCSPAVWHFPTASPWSQLLVPHFTSASGYVPKDHLFGSWLFF